MPLFGLSINILYFLFCIPDSPKYYFGKGDLATAKKIMEQIARVNGVQKEISFIAADKEENMPGGKFFNSDNNLSSSNSSGSTP